MSTKREKIQTRQNEEGLLKIQFSARKMFNKAESNGNIAWILCFLSALAILIPSSAGLYVQTIIPLMCDALALVASLLQSNHILKAADYRAYFDSYVLDIEYNTYKINDRRQIHEDAEECCRKYANECAVQIKNTGFDDPPGVKDWYDLSDECADKDTQLECQRQNAWWDERLSKTRILILIVVSVLIIIGVFTINRYFGFGVSLRVVLSSAIIMKTVERIIQEWKYIKLSHKIDGAISVMGNGATIKNIQDLQKLINERRRCNVVGMNIIHKIRAKSLSNIYRSRKQHS